VRSPKGIAGVTPGNAARALTRSFGPARVLFHQTRRVARARRRSISARSSHDKPEHHENHPLYRYRRQQKTLQIDAANLAPTCPNQAKALHLWLRQLPARAHLVLGASGGYEKLLTTSAHRAGVPVLIINPVRVRAFAKARGQRAKTDRIDTALYTATLIAIRQKASPLRDFYLRLRTNGKPGKVALIACARRLLTHLNSQLKNHELSPK